MVDEPTPKDTDPVNNSETPPKTPESVDASEGEAVVDAEPGEVEASTGSPEGASEDTASVDTQLDELREAVLRAKAEAQNIQRRAERDVENAHKYAVERFVKELLPVLDSMDRALELAETLENFDASALEGTQMTHKLLLDAVAKFGVVRLDPVGAPFDPMMHQAMTLVPSADHAPNTVLSVLQKGYQLHDRVIRAAMVVVTKAP